MLHFIAICCTDATLLNMETSVISPARIYMFAMFVCKKPGAFTNLNIKLDATWFGSPDEQSVLCSFWKCVRSYYFISYIYLSFKHLWKHRCFCWNTDASRDGTSFIMYNLGTIWPKRVAHDQESLSWQRLVSISWLNQTLSPIKDNELRGSTYQFYLLTQLFSLRLFACSLTKWVWCIIWIFFCTK